MDRSAGAVKEEFKDVAGLEADQQARRCRRAGAVGRRVRARSFLPPQLCWRPSQYPLDQPSGDSSNSIQAPGAVGTSTSSDGISVAGVVEVVLMHDAGHEHAVHNCMPKLML
jgi:hypothetical protein